jgi:hypothetical protein
VFTVLGEFVRHANGEKMPKRCIVAGCNNIGDKEKEISLHAISYSGAKARSEKKTKEFKPEDFLQRFSHVEGESSVGNRWLKRDEVGSCVFPTIMPSADAQKVSDSHKRMVC